MKRYSKRKFSILALVFIIISIPLAVYSLVNLKDFDTREKAYDYTNDIETCQISFIYVNPSSIPLDTKVQANVSASTPGEAITQVMVMDRTGTYIIKKDYTDGRDKVSENFIVNPKNTGDFSILGTLTTDKGTRACVVKDNTEVRVVAVNNAPEFKTSPTSATPSNSIKVKDQYQYQFEVTDSEKDTINFAYSFTPNAEWLKPTIIENGTSGKLSIKFSGSPDKPGSYLANIFVHDGYNAHLRAQTWIINVDQDKNDTPKVSIIKPSTDITVKKGEKITVGWEGSDLNMITKYELYIASNPGNENTWIAIDKSLNNKIGNYIFDTKALQAGTYNFIVRAFDNYNPPAVGSNISAKVTITDTNSGTKGPDDGVVIQEAQITNISPSNESSIKNRSASISATLIPSSDATIKKDTIKIILDDNDITSKARINEVLDNQYSVLYTPDQEYSEGLHKVTVSFEDTKGNKAVKDWTFRIVADETNTDIIKLFGFEIPKRLAIIVASGLAILLLALIVPWLLYLAWRGSKDNEDEYVDVYENTTPPPSDIPVVEIDEEVKPEPDSQEKKEDVKKINFPVFNINNDKRKQTENTEVESKENVTTENQDTFTSSIKPVIAVEEKKNDIPVPLVTKEEVPAPIVTTADQDNKISSLQTEIETDTDKELEALAEKLRKKEEMLSEFMPTQSNTAPSSSDEGPKQSDVA